MGRMKKICRRPKGRRLKSYVCGKPRECFAQGNGIVDLTLCCDIKRDLKLESKNAISHRLKSHQIIHWLEKYSIPYGAFSNFCTTLLRTDIGT